MFLTEPNIPGRSCVLNTLVSLGAWQARRTQKRPLCDVGPETNRVSGQCISGRRCYEWNVTRLAVSSARRLAKQPMTGIKTITKTSVQPENIYSIPTHPAHLPAVPVTRYFKSYLQVFRIRSYFFFFFFENFLSFNEDSVPLCRQE